MTITEAIKDHECELKNGQRRMFWSAGEWIVSEHKRYQRNPKFLIYTLDEEQALRILCKQD